MQIQQPSDSPLLDHPSNMKVKLEIPKQAMAPSRSLPRSASELGDPASPFSSNPAHQPVTVPAATPGLSSSSCSSFGRMASPPTDSPPITPTKQPSQSQSQGGGNNKQQPSSNKPTPTPAAAAAAYYASLWSPRRLMQRAARAFRRSRSRGRVVRTVKDLADERASSSLAAAASSSSSSSKVSDASAAAVIEALPPPAPAPAADEIAGGNGDHGGGAVDSAAADDYHHEHEVVPEKIIHEDAPPAPPAVFVADEEKETAAAAAGSTEEEEEVESPKKGAAAAAPEPESPAKVAEDKFVTVVKAAIKKQQYEAAEHKDEKKRFQLGSRVRTAMEARSESEQPRRREVARSPNDVIEEACTKLLEKRQCSRVKALVGAFETVMDNTSKDVAAAGKPQHRYRKST